MQRHERLFGNGSGGVVVGRGCSGGPSESCGAQNRPHRILVASRIIHLQAGRFVCACDGLVAFAEVDVVFELGACVCRPKFCARCGGPHTLAQQQNYSQPARSEARRWATFAGAPKVDRARERYFTRKTVNTRAHETEGVVCLCRTACNGVPIRTAARR